MKNNVMDMISITDSPLFHPDSPKIGEEDSHDGKWKLPDFSFGPPSDFWFAWILCCGMHCGFALYWVCSGAGELRIWVAPRYCPRHPLAPLVTSLALRVWMHCVCVACCVVACLCFPSSSRRRLPSGLELRSMAHSSSPGGAWIGGAAYCNPGACVRCLRVLRRAASCPMDWNCATSSTGPRLVARGWAALLCTAYWNLGVCVRCASCVVPPLWIGIALHHPQVLAAWCVDRRRCLLDGIWARAASLRVLRRTAAWWNCNVSPTGPPLLAARAASITARGAPHHWAPLRSWWRMLPKTFLDQIFESALHPTFENRNISTKTGNFKNPLSKGKHCNLYGKCY